MLLQACVNGARLPGEHPSLPVTPGRLAADVAAVVASGAGAVHLHVKDGAGADTFDGGVLAATLDAVRAAAPGVPLGVTTGAWALPDPRARVAAVRSWPVLPDFASVNWHEPGADDVAAALLGRGVGVEAGLWHAAGVAAWSRSPLRSACLRVLVEVPDGGPAGWSDDDAVAEADDLLRCVAHVGASPPVLLHGEGTTAWPVLRHAVRLGLDTRIGLEDALVMPDGAPAPGNAALVAAARDLVATG